MYVEVCMGACRSMQSPFVSVMTCEHLASVFCMQIGVGTSTQTGLCTQRVRRRSEVRGTAGAALCFCILSQ